MPICLAASATRRSISTLGVPHKHQKFSIPHLNAQIADSGEITVLFGDAIENDSGHINNPIPTANYHSSRATLVIPLPIPLKSPERRSAAG